MNWLKWSMLMLAALAPQANAGIFDDFSDLKGKTVLYAGDFDPVKCPYGGKYNCDTFPRWLLKAKDAVNLCVDTRSINLCTIGCKGIIAADKTTQYLFLFESSMGNELKKYSFTAYKCPDD